MKDFDPYLQFGPGDMEADYRKREAERRAYIAAEQAKGTPQGDLNASGAAVGQMADAAAHGAANSPEFQSRWDALVDSTAKLRAQMVREGHDVSEFDNRLREDLRHIMKAKGVPDAKIDALFAANPNNPLEAAKAFVAEQKGTIGEKEIGEIARKAADYKDTAEVSRAPAPLPAAADAMVVDAMAKFKASGVTLAEDGQSQPTSGLTASVAMDRSSSRTLH